LGREVHTCFLGTSSDITMTVTVKSLLYAEPDWYAQIGVTAIYAVWMAAFVPLAAKYIVLPFLEKHPMKEQWIELNHKMFKEGYGIDYPRDLIFKMTSKMPTWIFNHFLGGVLTLAAVFWKITPLTAALARHGALLETGFEVSDIIPLYGKAFGCFGAEAKTESPLPMVILMTMHHVMALGLVLPMNMYFSEDYWYFSLVCTLQFVSAIAFGTQVYGYLIDITTKKGLMLMKFMVFVTVVTMWVGRGGLYVYCCVKILGEMKGALFWTGIVATVFMGLLNLMMIMDSSMKAAKYLPMKLDPEALRLNKRRSQVILTEALGTGSGPAGAGTSQSVRRISQGAANNARRLSNSALGTKYDIKKLQEPLLAP